MIHLNEYLKEALNQRRLDASQLFQLYSGEIDAKSYAVNNDVSVEEAEDLQKTLKSGNIVIVSDDQIRSTYDKDKTDDILDDLDALVNLGLRYGKQMDMTPEEKKQRAEEEKKLAEEDPSFKPTTPGEDDVDDSSIVNSVNTDFVKVKPENVDTYFWKKAGRSGYLFFILNTDDNVQKIIDNL